MTAGSVACSQCATPLPERAAFCPTCGSATPTRVNLATGQAESAPPPDNTDEHRDRLQQALGSDYTLGDLIGQGGFGTVYAATDRKLDRAVAIKALRSDLFASAQLLQRFQLEARSAARIRHPHALPIYSVGGADGLAWMVMPHITGESLRSLLQREGRLPFGEALRIAIEVGGALEAAHQAGLVHRDVKPENILLDGPGRHALLMDFGIVKAMESSDATLTGTGMLVGTPAYMSPEQAAGERDLDGRTDLYALGCVSYEMLAGATPFGGPTMGLIGRHISEPPKPLEEAAPQVPYGIARAIDRALEKRREDRFASCADFVIALGAAQATPESLPAGVGAPPLWHRPLGILGRQASRRVITGVGRIKRVRRWKKLAALALVLGAGLALFGRGSLVRAWANYRNGQNQVAVAPRMDDPNAPPGWLDNHGNAGVTIVPLGDTAFAVIAQYGGPAPIDVFNGERWTRILVEPSNGSVAIAAVDNGFLMLNANRAGMTWRLAGGRLVRGDSCPIATTVAWSDGNSILAAGQAGVAVRSAGAWRLVPTGRRVPLQNLWGRTSDDVSAIGIFASSPEQPDSIASFDGFAWRTSDPRTDKSVLWVYNEGIALKDGSQLVVGYVDVAGRPPLVLTRPPHDTTWTVRNIRWTTPGPALFHVTEAGTHLYAWTRGGGEVNAGRALFEISGDSAVPVASLRGHAVAGIASIQGRPFIVTTEGLVWTRGPTTWGVATQVPGAGELAGVGAGQSASVEVNNRRGLLQSLANAAGFHAVRRIITPDSTDTFWLLNDDGRMARAECARNPCSVEPVPTPGGRGTVADLVVVRFRGVVAAGSDGLVARWASSGGWQRVALPAAVAGQSFIRAASDSAGRLALLSATAVVQLGRDGQVLVSRLPAGMAPAMDLAIGPTDSIAVLAAGGQIAIGMPGDSFHLSSQYLPSSEYATSIAWIRDGRLMVTTAHPDPLRGGALLVRSAKDNRWVSLVTRMTGLAGAWAGPELAWVAGTGWYAGTIPLRGLPFSTDTTRVVHHVPR